MKFDKEFTRRLYANMTPQELVIELLDKCMVDIRQAMLSIGKKDFDTANSALIESQEILLLLQEMIQTDDKRAQTARLLLDSIAQELFYANIRKDSDTLNELFYTVKNLKTSYYLQKTKRRPNAKPFSERGPIKI